MPAPFFWLHPVLIGALLVLSFLSLGVGDVPLPWADVWQAMWGGADNVTRVILWEVRLPRLMLAWVVGASLGVSGAALQGYLRNPLAEAGLLGVSSGAALGAVVATYSGWVMLSHFFLPLSAMTGALLAVGMTWWLSGRRGQSEHFILAGIAVSSFFGAAVAVALNLAPNPFAAMDVVFWLMGSLADKPKAQVLMVVPFILLGVAVLFGAGRGIEFLTLGERSARSLGVSLGRVQWQVVLGIALAVGASVSVSGSIGFVGLVVPHLLRPLVGYNPRRLLWASLWGGALLLLLADLAVRLIPTSGMELRIGVVTAFIGAPFLLLLLVHNRRKGGAYA